MAAAAIRLIILHAGDEVCASKAQISEASQ